MKTEPNNKKGYYLDQNKEWARLQKAWMFLVIVVAGLFVRVLPSKAGNSSSNQALIPLNSATRAEKNPIPKRGLNQLACFWNSKNALSAEKPRKNQNKSQFNTALLKQSLVKEMDERRDLVKTQAVRTPNRTTSPDDDGDRPEDFMATILVYFDSPDASLFVKRLKNFYLSNKTILEKKASYFDVPGLPDIPINYMIGEWENLLVIPKINQNYKVSQKIVSQEFSVSTRLKEKTLSLRNKKPNLKNSAPISDFLFKTPPLNSYNQNLEQLEQRLYTKIRSIFEKQITTLENSIEDAFGLFYKPNINKSLISFAQNPESVYKDFKNKQFLIPPHFKVIRDTTDIVFNKACKQRFEIIAKFPFFFDGTYSFSEKSPNSTLQEILTEYTKNPEQLKKRLRRADCSGTNYSNDPLECFDQMETNLLEFVLGYAERVSRRPVNTFASEQNALRSLSIQCKQQRFLFQGTPEFDIKKWEYETKKKLFDNLENSKLILKVLRLETGEVVSSICEDVQRFGDLISFYENKAISLSNKACELIGSQLKTPFKEAPNDEDFDFLKNLARLYSPGFLMDMGEQQILNWVNFCQELQNLAKNSVLLKEVCLSDSTDYNNKVVKAYFDYLQDARLD